MAGFEIIEIQQEDGRIDLSALRAVVGDDTRHDDYQSKHTRSLRARHRRSI